MPDLTTISHLELGRAEEAFSAAALDFRYAADQLNRACIAIRDGRLAIAEDAIRRYVDAMDRGFAAINDLDTPGEDMGSSPDLTHI